MKIPNFKDDVDGSMMAAWMDFERMCSRCRKDYLRGDFPVATIRGSKVLRAWCRACCLSYWKERSQKRREKQGSSA